MTREELLVVLDVLDLDYDLNDSEDLDWLDRSLSAINRSIRQLKRKK